MFFKSSVEGWWRQDLEGRMAGSGLAIDEIYVNLTIGRDFFGGQGHRSLGLRENGNPTQFKGIHFSCSLWLQPSDDPSIPKIPFTNDT